MHVLREQRDAANGLGVQAQGCLELRVRACIATFVGGAVLIAIGFLLATTPVVQNLLVFVTPRSIIEASLQSTFSDASLVDDTMVDRYHSMLLREGSREASLARFQL